MGLTTIIIYTADMRGDPSETHGVLTKACANKNH